jgi:cytochrome c peroxidase
MRASPVCILLALIGGAVATNASAQWSPLPAQAPAPADNPTTPAKVELGKMLFFDPRLSSTGTVACASCHNVMEGGDDHRPTSMGVHGLKGGRNAPTVWNAAFLSTQFWDGRAASLEDQAKGPITNPVEMGMPSLDLAVDRIKAIAGYTPWFERAFGNAQIDVDRIAMAIATYERTLITPGSAYDRFAAGDASALDEQQRRGMETFAISGCIACHSGANFSGPERPQGTGFFMKFPTFPDSPHVAKYALDSDPGREQATGQSSDRGYWRVPSLRNLVYTAPYFHNGSVKSLSEAAKVMASTQLNKALSDAEADDIAAFLRALTGPFPDQTMPHLPPTPGAMLE